MVSKMELMEDTIAKALAGDRDAREWLGRWLQALLRRSFSRRFRQDADDLLQETVADVLAALHRAPRDEANFTLWVLGVARNERRERVAAEKQVVTRAQLHTAHAQNIPTPPSIDAAFAHSERLELVRMLLAELPVNERQVMFARLEGYSFPEIAAALGIKESTARTRARRARQRLRARWEEERLTGVQFRS